MAAAKVTIRRATQAHVEQLASIMRGPDAQELAASSGWAPLEALQRSVAWSERHGRVWAGFIDGELCALFGVGRPALLGELAVPWLLTGPGVARHPREFWRTCQAIVAAWRRRYPLLVQNVDARYTAALRWAERLGFEVAAPEPFGVGRLPFCRIVLRRPYV